MPSTYTNNLGIELPADGELDGVWGDVVNENMDILDRAINGVLTLSLSGTSSTLTTSNGTLSDGQYKLLRLTGTPSGTHTITIAPNDAEKIYFVNNLTAQTVEFNQGSGDNAIVFAGDSAIVYANGAGAGGTVVNLTDTFGMNSVNITGGSITGLSSLSLSGTSPSITFVETDTTDQDARIRINLGELIFETVTDTGTQVRENMRIDSVGRVGIGTDSPDTALEVSSNTNPTAAFIAYISGTTMTVTGITSGALAVGDRVFGAGVEWNTVIAQQLTGTTGASGTYRVSNSQTVSTAPTGIAMDSGAAGDSVLRLTNTDTTDAPYQTTGAVEFYGSDATAGAGVKGYVALIAEDSTPSSALLFGTSDDTSTAVAVERMRIDSTGNVGIGTKSPTDKLNVVGTIAATGGFTDTGTDSTATHVVIQSFRSGEGSQTGGAVRIRSVGDGTGDAVEMILDTDSTERVRIDGSGNVGIGTATPAAKLDVIGSARLESTSPSIIFAETDTTNIDARVRLTDGDLIFETVTDAGAQVRENMRIESTGSVGINKGNPVDTLDVVGTIAATGGFTDTGTDSTATQVMIQSFRSGEGSQTGGAVRIRSIGDGTGSATQMILDTDSTERVRIDGSGNVGIGTSNPTEVLHVVGNARVEGTTPSITLAENDTTNTDARLRVQNGALLFETVTDGGTLVRENMQIGSTGNITIDTNTLFVDAVNNRVGVGTTSPADTLDVVGTIAATGGFIDTGGNSTGTTVILQGFRSGEGSQTGGAVRIRSAGSGSNNATQMIFDTNSTEAMRIDASQNFLVGTTDTSPAANNVAGIACGGTGIFSANTSGTFHRIGRVQDGTVMSFYSAGTAQGNISISGTTVSYNGGHLARWSQTADGSRIDGLLKGTILTNLDQMAVWGSETNEQLNCMAVSSVEGDPNVAGVFVNWDNDDPIYTADMNVAMTGDMVIRIAAGTTVQRGDLLMSAGDGTAKPQGDDMVRAKTIAKVTSTYVSETYADGSYVVPCVLMAC